MMLHWKKMTTLVVAILVRKFLYHNLPSAIHPLLLHHVHLPMMVYHGQPILLVNRYPDQFHQLHLHLQHLLHLLHPALATHQCLRQPTSRQLQQNLHHHSNLLIHQRSLQLYPTLLCFHKHHQFIATHQCLLMMMFSPQQYQSSLASSRRPLPHLAVLATH